MRAVGEARREEARGVEPLEAREETREASSRAAIHRYKRIGRVKWG